MAATAGIVEVGPWGGEGGTKWNFELKAGERLTGIKICSITDCVYSIQFVYVDIDDVQKVSRVYGGTGGDARQAKFADNEYVIAISGIFGSYNGQIIITSLSFKTNLNRYGPYGKPEGSQGADNTFSLPVANGKFVGYFGKDGNYLVGFGAKLKSG